MMPLPHKRSILTEFFSQRIFNDRELDAALFIAMLGFWMGRFSSEIPGWHRLFQVVHMGTIASLIFLVGIGRLVCAFLRRPRVSALAALATAFVFLFLGFLLLLTEWRLTMTPVAFFMGYHGFKSYLRISVLLRVPEE